MKLTYLNNMNLPLLTSGIKGGSWIPASSLFQLRHLKNSWCFSSRAPILLLWHPSLCFGDFFKSCQLENAISIIWNSLLLIRRNTDGCVLETSVENDPVLHIQPQGYSLESCCGRRIRGWWAGQSVVGEYLNLWKGRVYSPLLWLHSSSTKHKWKTR
jgi:hypothetical protein